MNNMIIDIKMDLLSGEVILWSGKPSIKKVFNSIDFILIPLGIIWTFGGIFYQKMANDIRLMAINVSEIEKFIYLIPILIVTPVILLGLYLLFIRYLVKVFIKSKTRYILTNCRICIIQKGILKREKYLNIKNIEVVDIYKNKNNIGTLFFKKTPQIIKDISIILMEIPWIPTNFNSFIFFDLTDAINVKEVIDNCKNQENITNA